MKKMNQIDERMLENVNGGCQSTDNTEDEEDVELIVEWAKRFGEYAIESAEEDVKEKALTVTKLTCIIYKGFNAIFD